jgi:RNA polymerase sigma factor (sigma-70 family)
MQNRNTALMEMWPFIAKTAKRMSMHTRRAGDWRDLAHDAVVTVLRQWHNFKPDWGVKPLSYFGIAVKRSILRGIITGGTAVHRPEKCKSFPRVVNGEDMEARTPCRSPGPADEAADADENAKLKSAMGGLQDRTRDVVNRIAAGDNVKAIARSHNVTKQRVYQIEQGAYRVLRRKLGA